MILAQRRFQPRIMVSQFSFRELGSPFLFFRICSPDYRVMINIIFCCRLFKLCSISYILLEEILKFLQVVTIMASIIGIPNRETETYLYTLLIYIIIVISSHLSLPRVTIWYLLPVESSRYLVKLVTQADSNIMIIVCFFKSLFMWDIFISS